LNARLAREMVGRQMSKGEMVSFFQFGGSDCVVVFERKANVAVTATRSVHYPICSQYAVATFND
jgi:phosphatidylserine decarboxylase